MKFSSKKKTLLATLGIMLACSSVWAMPSGGSVAAGDVNGVTSGDLTVIGNDVTFNVNANSLIDWDKFNIGASEAIRFVFRDNGLQVINHVTGSELSQILGTLTGDRDGHVMLINPNGIIVGNGANINVGALTLSTLNAGDDMLKNYLNGTGDLVLSGGSSNALKLQGGTISVSDLLNLYGGKVEIADGVMLMAGTAESIGNSGNTSSTVGNIVINAANQTSSNTSNKQRDINNTVAIHGSTIRAYGNFDVNGGNVSISDTCIEAVEDVKVDTFNSGKGNVLTIDNSTINHMP